MASTGNMIYQEGYFPPPPPPPTGSSPPLDARRRSSSYTDRYRPRNYSNPPPGQADPALLGPYQQPQSQLPPHQIPLPMSNPASPWQQQPPYPTGEQALMPRADMPIVAQRALADELQPRGPVMYPDGLRRPSYDADAQARRYSQDGRRPSYDADAQMRRASYDGRRPSYDADAQLRRSSHDSRRSNHSHHSHRPRYEDDDALDADDEEYERRHSHHDHDHDHHHHHHHNADEDSLEEYRKKKRDRGDDVSRSFGDSLVSVFGQPLKWLIEPRDKY